MNIDDITTNELFDLLIKRIDDLKKNYANNFNLITPFYRTISVLNILRERMKIDECIEKNKENLPNYDEIMNALYQHYV